MATVAVDVSVESDSCRRWGNLSVTYGSHRKHITLGPDFSKLEKQPSSAVSITGAKLLRSRRVESKCAEFVSVQDVLASSRRNEVRGIGSSRRKRECLKTAYWSGDIVTRRK